MLIFSKTADLRAYLSQITSQNKTVGFVPTMGALHNGHLSLIKASKDQCDFTICSIFVNPTQFNDKADLERYPRMPEKDAKLLEKACCDALFLPSVEEVYPNGQISTENFDFGYLDTTLEGEHRPGHFKGVAQVVKRFFEIVQPNKAFFGSKDYQQVMVVKELVSQLKAPIEIIPCPILRESDGLAMSSRNTLLNEKERKLATRVPEIMKEAKKIVLSKGIEAAKRFVSEAVSEIPEMKLDYYECCDAANLVSVNSLNQNKTVISLIAVFVGKIRIIDNLILN